MNRERASSVRVALPLKGHPCFKDVEIQSSAMLP